MHYLHFSEQAKRGTDALKERGQQSEAWMGTILCIIYQFIDSPITQPLLQYSQRLRLFIPSILIIQAHHLTSQHSPGLCHQGSCNSESQLRVDNAHQVITHSSGNTQHSTSSSHHLVKALVAAPETTPARPGSGRALLRERQQQIGPEAPLDRESRWRARTDRARCV